MTCREFVDFLMAYLDRELEATQRSVFDEHMDACPPCREYLATYEQTIRAGKLACGEDAEPPADAPESLIRAILAAREAS